MSSNPLWYVNTLFPNYFHTPLLDYLHNATSPPLKCIIFVSDEMKIKSDQPSTFDNSFELEVNNDNSDINKEKSWYLVPLPDI